MARPIMIQGTMSNAGKSLIAAGLCRIFRQDGYRVCPFKSQNMALNSYITEEGLEMGRAQVMQAEACGISPSALMNPILLKPTGDTGSQVIINGEVYGNMSAAEYFQFRKSLKSCIQKAYQSLEQEYDIIVIEGAGSPAEINLNRDDIVNMGMAEIADAPVLLVGDIDRGGVFAQLYGTVMLLKEQDRNRIRGLIINKFRGDVSLLAPGLDQIESLCGIPVLGVMPYGSFDIDDEDSLAERIRFSKPNPALLDIAVIRLPHLSNFTDFNVFETVPGVSVRYVDSIKNWGSPDMLILPGTKNTIGDLIWLKESGFAALIRKMAEKQTPIFGICGGFQMLGLTLSDPEHIEFPDYRGDSITGLGLLPVHTVFTSEKKRTRVSGEAAALEGFFAPLSHCPLSGYEIHMGNTFYEEKPRPFSHIELQNNSPVHREDGCCRPYVCGTYLHGIFDNEQFLQRLINLLFERKGTTGRFQAPDRASYKESQYNLLAETLRKSINMESVYSVLNL